MQKLLKRQIQRHLNGIQTIPPEWQAFLSAVSQTYEQFDEDYGLLERAMDLTSDEMLQKNAALEEEIRNRKKAEKEIQRLIRQNQLILDSAGEGICGVDLDGITTFCNPAGLQMTGHTADNLVGESHHCIMHNFLQDGTTHHRDECPICITIKSGTIHHVDDEAFWRKDGTCFPVEYICRPIYENYQIVGAVLTFKDITERRKGQEALKSAYDNLEQRVEERTAALKRSNQELEEFAYIASHDLKEPLRKVVTFGDRLLETETQLTSKGKNYLERMQKSVLRMQNLIDDLLDYSRLSSKSMVLEPVNFTKIVQKLLVDLEARIKKTKGTIHIGPLPTCEAEPTQMRQLFQNLITNSLKYHRQGVPPVINLTSSKNGNGTWKIQVEDNGIGFDEKYADRIFHLFERLHGKSDFEGTGMGLAICEKIVSRHHGSITARSVPQKGSTFIIHLPEKKPK